MDRFVLSGATREEAIALPSEIVAGANPGLLLDRLVPMDFDFKQESQYDHLKRVVESMGNAQSQVEDSLADWDAMAWAVGGGDHAWTQDTVWHMALHLARATALENASLCLHPVYGFPYIPGSGLKGLARSAAQLCFDRPEEDADLLQIFGKLGGTGSVVFLDAWPAEWPEIKVDITNNHHRDYYSSEGDTPPGDWESPNPVYFLVVAPGVKFKFAVAKTTPQTSDDDLDKARKWLQGGLQELGVGAKTAAGYGYFSAAEDMAVAPPPPPNLSDELSAFHQELTDWLAERPSHQNMEDLLKLIGPLPEGQKTRAVELALQVMDDHPLLDMPLRNADKPTLRERLEALRDDG